MVGYSEYAKNALLDALLNGVSFSVAQAYASLHTSDPGDTGAGEVTGGSYARQAASFEAADAGATQTDATLVYLDMPAATLTHVGLWDAASGGNFLGGAALPASKAVLAGEDVTIATGALDANLNN